MNVYESDRPEAAQIKEGHLILLIVFMGYLSRTFAQEQSTQKQLPIFINVTKQAGIDFTHSFGDENLSSILETTGPGGAFLDYDRDGDLDIYAVNGAYLPGINDPYPAGHDPKKELYNHLYRNNGDGTFTNVALEQGVALGGFGEVTSAMGPTFKDIDNDGDIDIFVINMSGPSILLRNDGGNQNHWLTVRAIGTKSNRDGIGARISLVAGNRRQTAEVIAGEGYLSCNDPRVHFGLGTDSDFQSLKDSGNLKIEIRWPSGIGQTLTNVKVDQILTVTEPNE